MHLRMSPENPPNRHLNLRKPLLTYARCFCPTNYRNLKFIPNVGHQRARTLGGGGLDTIATVQSSPLAPSPPPAPLALVPTYLQARGGGLTGKGPAGGKKGGGRWVLMSVGDG